LLTMTASATAPYGTWPTPITARAAAAGLSGGQLVAPSYLDVVGDEVWWVEPRPQEQGRMALMRRAYGEPPVPVLPTPWNPRSRVIEYGGRPWHAAATETGVLAVFVHFDDQRLYAVEADSPGAQPRPLTPLSGIGAGARWAEPEIDLARGEVRGVLEEFTGSGPGDVRRVIAAVSLDGSAARERSAIRELTDDRSRFISSVRYAPDGRRVCWLAWDHPHMPWDAAALHVADIDKDGSFRNARTLIGGPGDPIAQAEWTPDGRLLVAAERTGWWNLYRVSPKTGAPRALFPAKEEFAGLQRMGLRWFLPLPDGRVATLHGRGAQRLALLEPATGQLTDVAGPWTEWLPCLAASSTHVIGVAGAPSGGLEVVSVEIDTAKATAVVDAPGPRVARKYLPEPEPRTFTGPDGREIHAVLHAPRHPRLTGPADSVPPYIVWAHPGPGLRPIRVRNLEIAFFTSRGFGVVEVDYGGTPGYGRAYRDRLRERWGETDVEDCAAVARALLEQRYASKVAIRGLSAGGFTAAASLVSTDVYAGAMLLCPLLDLTRMARGGTHDFEAHYLDWLIGPLALVPSRYRDRSPAAHPERITAPFVLVQGAEDVVCPPEQSTEFVARVREKSAVDHVHRVFDGEGHGFRRLATIARSLELELALYERVFGFVPDKTTH
jgi:dipeptidyl aminopeptidase/acylaminoacyl peptidase